MSAYTDGYYDGYASSSESADKHIATLENRVTLDDRYIAALENGIARKDEHIASLENGIARRDENLDNLVMAVTAHSEATDDYIAFLKSGTEALGNQSQSAFGTSARGATVVNGWPVKPAMVPDTLPGLPSYSDPGRFPTYRSNTQS